MKIRVRFFISACFLILIFCSNQLQADNITYKYDELNRIIQVIYDDGTTVTYTYDKVGNRLIKNVSFTQETVSTPSISRGLTRRFQGTQYSYLVRGSSSSLHHPVQYFIDWGDGTDSGWLAVGKTSVIKAWTSGGTYLIKAQARCATHTDIVSNWSTFLSVDIIGPPSAATLISPTGTVTDTIPTYTWNAVSNAAWYHLWVNDQTANKINAWYTAEACGCAAGTCTITPATEVIGSCQWWVQTYNSAGFGPWSSGMTFTAPIPTVPPGAATQVSPTGAITDTTPTYTWNAVSGASWYCLYVNDSTGNKINQWYTRGEAGCASGTGTCSVTPTTEVRGSSQWWVRTYNPAGFGPWSTPMAFTVSP